MKDVYTIADLRNWSETTVGIAPAIRLAVFGDPVAHSKSPAMQNAALAVCGIDAQYIRLHIHPEELAEAVRLLPANGFIGANFTIPHKVAMLGLVDEVDPKARKAGGVNTVLIRDGKLHGFSTDGPGLVQAVRSEFGADIRDLRVLLLGAGGGAGRAIAVQCALEKCARLVLVNRTFEKAEALAVELQQTVDGVSALPWDEAHLAKELADTDLVINASSAGMKPGDPSPVAASLLSSRLMIYDTIYTATRTPLLRAADEVGARGANGLSMLLHQGAQSFEIWFNREAPVDAMRKALESA